MQNFLILSCKILKGDKKTRFYICIIIVLIVALVLSFSILNCSEAFNKDFFTSEFSREVRILGYYEETKLPFYYSQDFIDKMLSREDIAGYTLDYRLKAEMSINIEGKNLQIALNSIESTYGVFTTEQMVQGDSVFAGNKNSIIISQSMANKLFGLTDGVVGNSVLLKYNSESWRVSVIGVFADHSIENDISIGGALSEQHIIASGDIGRVIYDLVHEGTFAQLKLMAIDSKFVPEIINAVYMNYPNLYVISEYEQIAEFVELFNVVNIVLVVIILALILSSLLNVCDVFTLIVKDNSKRTAIMLAAGYRNQDIVKIFMLVFIVSFVIAVIIGLIIGLIFSLIINFGVVRMLSLAISALAFFPNILILAASFLGLFVTLSIVVYLIIIANYKEEIISVLKEEQHD